MKLRLITHFNTHLLIPTFLFFLNKFIYFWLRWVLVAVRRVSLVAARGLLFVAVRGLLIEVVSLVVEYGL